MLFAGEKRYEFTERMMGSPFRLVFYATDDLLAEKAAEAVFTRIRHLDALLSDYRDGSEINRLSSLSGSGYWVKTSPELFDILCKSQQISRETGGAFDATVGTVVRLWRRSMLMRRFPERREIRKARRRTGFRYLELDSLNNLVRLNRKGIRLDVGGIGKGFAADEGIRVLESMGIRSALLDAGGDLALSASPPGTGGWSISIAPVDNGGSERVLMLFHCGVATSGADYRFIEHKGKKYSHIINPETGVGLQRHVRSTIVAPNGSEADALATAVSVLGIDKSRHVVTRFTGVKVWLQETTGRREQVKTWDTLFGKK